MGPHAGDVAIDGDGEVDVAVGALGALVSNQHLHTLAASGAALVVAPGGDAAPARIAIVPLRGQGQGGGGGG